MERSKISRQWPNALRWFLIQDLHSFVPWHFMRETAELEFAANAFRREAGGKDVFVFARRQDCDDFAGLEVVDGRITDRVIHFHPVFATGNQAPSTEPEWNIVCGVFDDVFSFMAERVVPDMKDWAQVEDASDIES